MFAVVASLLVSACSSGDEGTTPSGGNGSSDSVGNATVSLALQGGASSTRSVEFDLSNDGRKAVGSNDSWKTHIFLRKAGGSELGHATITFEQTAVNSGTSGTVALSFSRASVEFSGLTAAPAAGETWYIAGMVGGEYDESTGKVTFDNSTGDDALAANVVTRPYAFTWVEVTAGANGLISKSGLQINPLGSLIRFDVTNSRSASTVATGHLLFESTQLSGKGTFDFSIASNSESTLTTTAIADKWASTASGTYQQKLRFDTDVAVGSTTPTLMWGMPSAESGYTRLISSDQNDHIVRKTVNTEIAAVTTTALKSGYGYTMQVTVEDRPKLPIEYMAEYNLNADMASFATTHANDETQLLSPKAVKTSIGENTLTINGTDYRLPNLYELHAVFTPEGFDFNITSEVASVANKENVRLNYTVANDYYREIVSYYNTNNSSGTYTGYGMRFIGLSTATLYTDAVSLIVLNNKYRCAYKYEYVDNTYGTAGGKLLKVTVRYLGYDYTGLISDVSASTFWDTDTANDIVRYLPATKSGTSTTDTYYYSNDFSWITVEDGIDTDDGYNFEMGRASSRIGMEGKNFQDSDDFTGIVRLYYTE